MCKKCGGSDPCFIDFGDAPAPEYCPCDGERVVWREVPEPAALPKLTVEDSKSQLPDWLKLGAWAAVGNFVGKIDWISRDGSECRITCGESRFAKRDEVKAVTWRAWTRSEWCEQIGKRFKFSDGERMLLGVSDYESGFMIEFIDRDEAPDEFISEWHITQLNGMPCSVPQVDGKDLEGMPCD